MTRGVAVTAEQHAQVLGYRMEFEDLTSADIAALVGLKPTTTAAILRGADLGRSQAYERPSLEQCKRDHDLRFYGRPTWRRRNGEWKANGRECLGCDAERGGRSMLEPDQARATIVAYMTRAVDRGVVLTRKQREWLEWASR